jgi:hypothetical protein
MMSPAPPPVPAPSVSAPFVAMGTTNCPPNSLGLCLVSDQPQVPPLDLFGIGVLSNVTFLNSTFFEGFDMSSDANGFGYFTQSIQGNSQLIGLTFYLQSYWAWSDSPSCAAAGNYHFPYGLSSTNGVAITIQP